MPDLDAFADDHAAAASSYGPSSSIDNASALLVRASVSADHAALSRLLGCGCSIALPALDAVLSLHPADAAQRDAEAWNDALTLQGAFGSIAFAQGVRLMRALTQIDLDAELDADAERWEWLQAALIGRLGGTPLACADRVLRQVIDAGPATSTLRVCLRSGQHAIVTHARAAVSDWVDWLQRERWTPERTPSAAWLGLPFDTPVRVARHTLPSNVLRTLTVGDIVLPDSPRFSCDGEASIHIGALQVRVRYQAPGALEIIAVEGKLNSEDLEMMDGGDALSAQAADAGFDSGFDSGMPPADAQPNGEYAYQAGEDAEAQFDDGDGAASVPDAAVAVELDAVPVTLDFELGKVRMSLGELRTLGAGAVVPLQNGSPSAIAIVSAGRRLGSGEVVDINGQLGIRITQWGAPC